MKTHLLLLILIFQLYCSAQSNNKFVKTNVDNSFTNFVNKFTVLKLPLDIPHSKDLEKYSDFIVKEINEKTVLIPNPLCPQISATYYKYLKDKYPITKNFYYQSAYKKVLREYVLLVIKQINKLSGDYFLKLNVYSTSGNLLDTLCLAGQKIDDYDRYCRIDSNLIIKIRMLKDLTQPTQSREPWPKLETIEEYVITSDGHFKRTYFKQEKGLFIIKDGEDIRVNDKK